MTFLSPEWLWLFVVVGALIAFYLFIQFRRSQYAVRFSNLQLLRSVAPRRPGWRRHLAAALLTLSLGSGVVAMARPASMIKVPRQEATIMLCIDVSLSMQATDVTPTRLQAAQAAAGQFVSDVPHQFNVGLVSFAGSANLIVPPTTNHQEVTDGINQLQLAPSTAIGEAIYTSLDAIKLVKPGASGKPPPAVIVLLTDGATNSGRSNDEAASAAQAAGVPVDTIAFGTPNGTVTINGQTDEVPVDHDAVRKIASQTGGHEYDAYTAEQTRQIYQDLATQIGWTDEAREITMLFVGLGLALGFLAAFSSVFWQHRIP